MKSKIVSVLIAIALAAASQAQDNKVAKMYGLLDYNGKAFVYNKSLPANTPPDTLYFNKGVAIYKQDKYDGDIAWVYMTQVDRNHVHYMILEKGTITVTATKDSMIFFTGTPNNDAFFELDKQIEPLRRKIKVLQYEWMELQSKGEKEKSKSLEQELTNLANSWWSKQVDFALANKNLAGLNYLQKCMTRFSNEQLGQMLENYKAFAGNRIYKSVQNRYESELRTTKGVKPPDFNLPTPDGKQIALSSLGNKVVIIDFWASWCKPCRAENPNLVALYNKYRDKGLEIISVSIDEVKDKDKWIDAIKADGLTWLQVWDDNKETRKAYGITSIPRTYILDQKGIVLAKDLRGEELNKFIEKLFN